LAVPYPARVTLLEGKEEETTSLTTLLPADNTPPVDDLEVPLFMNGKTESFEREQKNAPVPTTTRQMRTEKIIRKGLDKSLEKSLAKKVSFCCSGSWSLVAASADAVECITLDL
jgi:hypothetical protein